LGHETGVGVSLHELGTITYHGKISKQYFVSNGVVYEKTGCSITEFNKSKIGNLIQFKEKIIDIITGDSASPFLVVGHSGRNSLNKMVECGAINPEDHERLGLDTKAWMNGEKCGVYAMDRDRISNHLKLSSITNNAGKLVNKVVDDLNFKDKFISEKGLDVEPLKARSLYEFLKRHL
jgi:hypothetical protein